MSKKTIKLLPFDVITTTITTRKSVSKTRYMAETEEDAQKKHESVTSSSFTTLTNGMYYTTGGGGVTIGSCNDSDLLSEEITTEVEEVK